MTGLVTFKDFVIVPKDMQGDFILKVVNGYFDTTVVNIQKANEVPLVTEENVSDQMVDMLYELVGRIEEEDDMHAEDRSEMEVNFGYFYHDVILVMERLKLSYRSRHEGVHRNLPAVGVW